MNTRGVVFNAVCLIWFMLGTRSSSVFGQVTDTRVPGGLQTRQSVIINAKDFNVLGPNGSFRNSSLTQFFNPTSNIPPFFQIFDPGFLDILGPNPRFDIIATSNRTPTFAHEAPIYVQETDEVFFVSSPDTTKNNVVSKISMQAVEVALKKLTGSSHSVNVSVTPLTLPNVVQQANGGTGPFKSSLLYVTDGFGDLPPSVVLVDPKPPFNATVLLDNFFGRQFNSMDDVKIHPTSGAIFFTDVDVGSIVGLRPPATGPNQVYRFDPSSGAVRVVATDFQECNGIAFNTDGTIAYVTDTGLFAGLDDFDQTRTATIYQYDVEPKSQIFFNRRIFAYADTGVPDGIIIDATGNVYAGCGDGVNVWSPDGVLLGKFFTGLTVANMVFAGDGRLVLLGGTSIYLATIAAQAGKVSFP